jgi:enoyl-CoA hydratase/carnithine racemase
MDETVLYEKAGGIAWVTLNRPDRLNVYNIRMRDELFEVLTAVRDDTEIRAFVLRGAGRCFCAGADLTEFGTAPSPAIARRVRFERDVWDALDSLEVPTVAALHGVALGSGLEMALFCDLRIAAEGTMLGFPEVRLGMIPAAGGTQTLPRAAGTSYALDLLLTGRRVQAAEAARHGMVSRVVPAERLAGEVTSVAETVARLDPPAVRAIHHLLRTGADAPLEQGLRREAVLAAVSAGQGRRLEGGA